MTTKKRTAAFRQGRREGMAIRWMREQGENPDPRLYWAEAAKGRTNEEFVDWNRGFSKGMRPRRARNT